MELQMSALHGILNNACFVNSRLKCKKPFDAPQHIKGLCYISKESFKKDEG